MEWVEVEAQTVDLAVEVAMADLGTASREDVEVEVVQEPSSGFLGMGGKEAIVKVTKAPKKRRRRRNRGRGSKSENGKPKAQQGQSRSSSNTGKQSQGRSSQKRQQEKKVSEKNQNPNQSDDRPEQAPIEEQAKVAADFISGLLGAFGLEGTVETRIDDGVLYLDVQGEQTEALVGPKGSVMQSVLELTRTVVQRKTYGAPRMRIDIAGYVERRREALKIYTTKLATQVVEEKTEVMLEPMNAADRKVVHDAVGDIDNVRSFSEGDEPRRAVVLAYDGD
ncbi:MAG: RNA-binding cell elongation regulator Jag/EloR [Acidimicrobiia bacterium]